MYKILLFIFTIFSCLHISAQTTQVKYYNNRNEEVPEKKARYVKEIISNQDGSVTTRETDIKKGEIVYSQTYKGDEPYGIWILQSWSSKKGDEQNKLDYDFPLVYDERECSNGDLLPKLDNYFEDNKTLNYTAPKISENEEIYRFLAKNIKYPAHAKENGIQGKIYAKYTIEKDGTVSNVSITKGAHVVLDKEYVRVIRTMKFDIPPTINGKPVTICVSAPASFRLE